jgi:hypothetical protein
MWLFHFIVIFVIINFFRASIVVMGNAIKSFGKFVAKAVITAGGNLVPVVGGPLASYINSKFAKGSYDIGTPGVPLPEGAKVKAINTPAQLTALVKQYPEEAQKAGLTVDMIKEEVKEAKEQAKAIGGMVSIGKGRPQGISGVAMADKVMPVASKAVGGDVPKAKKPRSEAQKKAIAKLVEYNKKKREGKQ